MSQRVSLDSCDSFSWTHVCDGPTAIPKDGKVGFYDLEQIADYTLDYALWLRSMSSRS